MTKILFIKQRIRRGPAIESSIEDYLEKAFRRVIGQGLGVYDLGEHIRIEEDRLRGADQQTCQRMRRAETEKCLGYIKENEFSDIFILNGYLANIFNPEFFSRLRTRVDRIAAWQLDDPYYIDLALPFLDHLDTVFTVDTATVPLYRRYNKNTEWLPLACDPAVHRPVCELDNKYRSDICFIGVPFKGSGRVRVINELAPALAGMNFRIIGAAGDNNWRSALANYNLVAGKVFDAFITVEDATRFYSGAAINLNLHKDSYGHQWDRNSHRLIAQSPCERTFSIAGCGGFQLIDSCRPDLSRLFDVGENIISFDDMADLLDKISYYLKHENERQEIANSLLDIVLKNHTYKHRVQHIIETAFPG